MNSLVAVVPARLYDRFLPGKNLLPFGEANLLVHKVRQLKRVSQLDAIVVTSDDPHILELATAEGVSTHRRAPEHAAPAAEFGPFVRAVAMDLECEHVLWASPTSPLVDEHDYARGIEAYHAERGPRFDSLITVHRIKRHLLDENGPLTFRFARPQRAYDRLPTLFEFTNGMAIAPRQSMIEWQYNWGPMPFRLELKPSKAINICDRDDYEYACFVYSKLQEQQCES